MASWDNHGEFPMIFRWFNWFKLQKIENSWHVGTIMVNFLGFLDDLSDSSFRKLKIHGTLGQSSRRVGNRASKITFFGIWTCTRCSKFLGFATFFIDHNMILHRNSPAFCRKHWYSLWFSWISLFFASSIWAVFFVKFEFRAGFGTTERVFFLQAIWFKIWAVLSARQPFMECSQRRCQHLTYVQRIGLKRPFFSVFTLGGMALSTLSHECSMIASA